MIDDLLNQEENLLNSSNGMSEAMQVAFSTYLADEQMRIDANQEPFNWLYRDIINVENLYFDFNAALGGAIYVEANREASVCLGITLLVSNMDSKMIFLWISSVLKTIDYVVVHYLQDYMGLEMAGVGQPGEDRARYRQLQGLPNPMGTAGTLLDNVYTMRNASEHRTLTNPSTGRVSLKRPPIGKIMQESKYCFHNAFKNILEGYKVAFAQHVLHDAN